MSDLRGISRKQFLVLDGLFAGRLDEGEVLARYKVSRNLYNKWQADEAFAAEFERRLAVLNRHSRLIIAQYATLAAAKLVQLTNSKSSETARRACLDIISFAKGGGKKAAVKEKKEAEAEEEISDETASRLLAALAEGEKEKIKLSYEGI